MGAGANGILTGYFHLIACSGKGRLGITPRRLVHMVMNDARSPRTRAFRSVFAVSFLALLLAFMAQFLWAGPHWSPARCALNLRPVRGAGAASLPATRSLRSLQRLKVMSYNVENFFASTGQIIRERGGVRRHPFKPASPKPRWAVEGIARAIAGNDPDVIVVVEVEKNIKTLQRFSEDFLGNAYEAFMLPGNDPRGINIGFLVKRDLPLEVVLESHVDDTWVDPTRPRRGEQPLFSRDLPVLSVYAKGFVQRGPPLITILGTHFKSKRDVPGDPLGNRLRGAQVGRTSSIVSDLLKRWGPGARLLLAGDFNGVVSDEEEFHTLRASSLRDPFDLLGISRAPLERATQSYFPPRGSPIYNQIDYVLASAALAPLVRSAKVHRYEGLNPLPRSFKERRKQPSDHNPVVVEFSMPEVVAAYESEVGAPVP